jgi:fluoride exporter
MTWLAVALGGAIGSMARHGVNDFFGHTLGRPGALATASVNVIGSFVIGLLAGLIAGGRLHETPLMRAFIFVGILGGFTTFSSFMLDTFTLAEGRHVSAALLNVTGQVILGYAAAYIGFRLGV